MRLQARVGEHTIDLDLEQDEVTIEGETVPLQVTRLGNHTLHLLVGNHSYVVSAMPNGQGAVRVTHRGESADIQLRTERDLLLDRLGMSVEATAGPQELRAPMPGLVVSLLVEAGQEVAAGQGLLVLEAMKMENELRADMPVTVGSIHVEPGTPVTKGELLISFA